MIGVLVVTAGGLCCFFFFVAASAVAVNTASDVSSAIASASTRSVRLDGPGTANAERDMGSCEAIAR